MHCLWTNNQYTTVDERRLYVWTNLRASFRREREASRCSLLTLIRSLWREIFVDDKATGVKQVIYYPFSADFFPSFPSSLSSLSIDTSRILLRRTSDASPEDRVSLALCSSGAETG